MYLFCVKCLTFTNNNTDVKIKREIDRIINACSLCVDCGFKKFETRWYTGNIKVYIKQCHHIVWSLEKLLKVKTGGWKRQMKEN